MNIDPELADELVVVMEGAGAYVPVSMRGMAELQRRCDMDKLDPEDDSTWGDVNWMSYREIDGALWVLKNSYEAARSTR